MAEQLAKFLETARRLPAGSDRHSILKQIGILRVRLAELQRKSCP